MTATFRDSQSVKVTSPGLHLWCRLWKIWLARHYKPEGLLSTSTGAKGDGLLVAHREHVELQVAGLAGADRVDARRAGHDQHTVLIGDDFLKLCAKLPPAALPHPIGELVSTTAHRRLGIGNARIEVGPYQILVDEAEHRSDITGCEPRVRLASHLLGINHCYLQRYRKPSNEPQVSAGNEQASDVPAGIADGVRERGA